MKKYNFYSGPAILPPEVFRQSAEAILDFNGGGLSLIEISHRSKDFMAVLEEAQQLVKELYGLSDEYKVLFLQGGASTQFCMVPYNLLDAGKKAAYLETGVWAKKAIKEAKLFGDVEVVASSADKNFSYIPKNYSIPSEASYFHLTTNNTIYGSQLRTIPKSPVPVVSDMSSDIFSHPINASDCDLIYAGAQKNIGPSGATLVILKENLLGKVSRKIPSMLDYKVQIDNGSMFNTPCTFAIYVCLLTMRWLKAQGGVAVIAKHNEAKANKLYAEIDRNSLFEGKIAVEDRSQMNVTWVITRLELEDKFNQFAKDNGCIGIKGHRSTGGFRASLYNAMPMAGVDKLVAVLQEFEKNNT